MIDSHVHLDDKEKFADIDGIINAFEKDNVEFVVNASVEAVSMQEGVALAERFDRVFCMIGMHPHEAKMFDKEFEDKMRELASHPKVVGVGEIGLDFFYDFSPREVQKEVFVKQLILANEFCLPVAIHLRDAYQPFLEILQQNQHLLKNGVVVHCYSGSREFAMELLKLGCFFSFGGAITFKKWNKMDVVGAIPLDKILTETDGPYMAPEPFRGQVAEPKHVKYVLQKLAEVKGISFEEMEKQVETNTKKLFKKLSCFHATKQCCTADKKA